MAYDWLSLIKHERFLEDNVRYGNVAEPWQLSLDQALLTNDRIYTELPRGHDKTGRLACHALCWLLDGTEKQGYATGVDKDNAKLFRDEMKAQARRNPAVFGDVEFYNYVVENAKNGNRLTILASDAPSNIGLKFNLLLINDFVDWKDQEFFEVLISATGKLPNIKIWVESNAGKAKRGYKWEFREYARKSKAWSFKTTKRWLASWTPESWFDEMARVMSKSSYRRLIGNEWVGDADTFLTDEQVNKIIRPDLTPALQRPSDVDLVATATDLGITKDAAAVVTVGRVKDNKPIRTLDMVVFPGSKSNPVQIADVEKIIDEHLARYESDAVIVDPWNMRKTIQDKEFEWPITEFTFSPANLMHLTSDVFRRVVNRQIEIYENTGPAIQGTDHWNLERELTTAIIRQMPYGERIDHKKSGYTDRIIALGMALWWLGENALPAAPREFSIKVI
jgi:hypothetical protein